MIRKVNAVPFAKIWLVQNFSGMPENVLGTELRRCTSLPSRGQWVLTPPLSKYESCQVWAFGGDPSSLHGGWGVYSSSMGLWWNPPQNAPSHPAAVCLSFLGSSWSSVGCFQIPAPLGLVKILYQCPSFSAGMTFNSALLSLPDLDNLQRKVAMAILHSAQPNLASVSY